ncbi:haloacid dehalogenase superfamily, subfamily IA, variant 3 with third motif having DD or ED [Streptomyces sp. TLI_053]|uniref:HAD family hydrolase n=1 Tax=Streptomyces sp. TLI_053 TaxID=1855352 RepID=UPI00087AF7B2|nr:HAD family phosphatase [Streptomyces sp. TLI_053]SDT83350.1 haloacid dehalogenase superfamily, subfamily IA, variant 3 with third motif having DD or ED [Streptomyces sp. TLI_053]
MQDILRTRCRAGQRAARADAQERPVVLDCDGVLVDSEAIASPIQAEALRTAGIPLGDEEYAALMVGRSRAEGYAVLAETYGFRPTRAWKDALHRKVLDAYTAHLSANAGAARLLERLAAQGRPWCVATSGTRESTLHKLAAAGLDRYGVAERLLSIDDVARGKPAPDLFLLAASTFGVEPGRVLVVEDSMAGVAAARAAGMRVLWYRGGPPAGADVRSIDHLDQVLDHLAQPWEHETGDVLPC